MKTYIVQYRVNGGQLYSIGPFAARSPAGAIRQATHFIADIEGEVLDVIATEQSQ